uniref:PNPLA domain-containing protein n=1 Tax=viral metagenome TaxID=1070528 RepID=A0A6C0AYY9_9ZZZZ|tara:strand:- start:1116 stop:2039 length:924 start_codon:yes stop_codon:yes gene_type:complete
MTSESLNSLNPLKNYIGALIENLDKDKIPKNIDLILDGGAFNGAFGYGCLIYLKKLENLKILKVDKISGCSIGAIIGLLYLTDSLDSNILLFENLLKSFRKTLFLDKLSETIHNLVNNIQDIEALNDKLFITYYDITTIKQNVVSKYKNKEELIEILIRSSYIPYITDGSLQYQEKYFDGCSPYIFPKHNTKALFIYLATLKKVKNTIFTQNEVNIWPRLLNGVIDINNFFSGSHSDMCSYINNWTFADFSLLRIREIIILILILIIKSCIFINNKIPENIKNNIYICRLQQILSSLYKDIFSYMVL